MSAPTIYRGYQLLTLEPNRREAPDPTLARGVRQLGSGYGSASRVDDLGGSTRLARPVSLLLDGRTAIADFYDLLQRRRGRMVPFWVPTWHYDLELAADVASTDLTISVRFARFTTDAFPVEARRHIGFILPNRTIVCRRITGAVVAGATETLTLESAPGVALPAKGTMPCYLLLSRLVEDDVEIRFHTPALAEVELRITELYRQVANA